MKHIYGFAIFLSSIFIATLFVMTTFVSVRVKDLERNVISTYKEIDELRIEIKRVKIEISALTNPVDVLEYIEQEGLKNIKVKDVINVKVDRNPD